MRQLVSTSGPSHAPLFVIKASLNEMSFEGSGKSKKDAKLNASKALLVHLHKARAIFVILRKIEISSDLLSSFSISIISNR